MNVNNIVSEINNLDFDSKSQVYTRCFGFGNMSSGVLNNKLILISLVALTVNKLKEKNKDLTTLDILLKITNTKPNYGFYDFLVNLSILVDDLAYDTYEFDSCGLTDSKQVINKINELVNQWLPF